MIEDRLKELECYVLTSHREKTVEECFETVVKALRVAVKGIQEDSDCQCTQFGLDMGFKCAKCECLEKIAAILDGKEKSE